MGAFAGAGLSLGTLFVNITAKVDEAIKSLDDFGTEAGKSFDKLDEKFSGLQKLGGNLTSIGSSLSLGLTAPIVGLAAAGLSAAGDLQALRMALDTVTGSSAETSVQMARLKEIAKLPGLGLEEAVKGTLALQNVGIEAQTAERYLKAFGNAVASAGGGKADLEAVVVQLRQMGATGKVTAEDLKPILERVPQVAAVTKEAFGTIDTEQLKKAGVTSEQFLSTIVAGLEKLPPVAGGIKNSMENLGDSSKEALAKIGAAFIPAMEAATPLIEGFLTKIGELATWFTNLPQPVQNFALAVAGIAAALGPVLVGLGTLITAFTTVAPVIAGIAAGISGFVSALGPLAAALAGPPGWIALITAALVALGVWIYANWDAIVSTLTNAWSGIQQAWSTVWTTITGAVTAVWEAFKNAIAPYWKFLTDLVSAVWNVVTAIWEAEWKLIVGVVTAVWDTIAPFIHRILDPVVGAIEELWDGIERLWDKAWDAITKVVTGAWDGLVRAAKTVFTPTIRTLGVIWTDIQSGWKRVWEGIETLLTGLWNRMAGAATKAWEAIAKIGNIITGIPAKLNTLATSIRNVGNEADKAAGHSPVPELADALEDVGDNATPLPPKLDAVTESIHDLGEEAGTIDVLEVAFRDLNAAVVPAHQNLELFGDFSNITSGLTGATTEVNNLGTAVSNLKTDGSRNFADFGQAAEGAKTTVEGAMGNMSRNVSTVITNFAQDVSKSLWEGDDSWGEKGKKLLSSLGQAVTSSFIEPAAKAIGDFISGAIKDLLGGEGLGGILSSIKDIGSGLADIFTGGAKAASGAAGAAGGAASGAGGAAGAAGQVASTGFTAIAGLVTGAISAVSGVISNFQFAGMNKSLDIIVNHTLATANDLANLRRDEWDRWGGWMLIKDDILQALQRIAGAVELAIWKYDDMLHYWERQQVNMETLLGKTERIALAADRSMTVNLNGTDPDLVASLLAQKLRMQGGFA